MKEITASIEINAPVEHVWQILTDFASYPTWNPFILSMSGELESGKKLNLLIRQSNGKAMAFKPVLLTVQKNHELRWLGHFILPGIFDGEHRFELVALEPGRTRFVHSEKFKGLLVPFLGSMLKGIEAGFISMNEALKSKAEAL